MTKGVSAKENKKKNNTDLWAALKNYKIIQNITKQSGQW